MDPKIDRLLSSSFELFAQHGFKKVTMRDIAERAGISRPTLYAAFPNKEAVFGALATRQSDRGDLAIAAKLPKAKSLEAQLSVVFDVWILEPFASVVDSPEGLDLLANTQIYAPDACADIYARFEEHLVGILAPAMTTKPKKAKKAGQMSARDLAHILTLATKGLKASTATLVDLRRMTDGLIAMAVATAAGKR